MADYPFYTYVLMKYFCRQLSVTAPQLQSSGNFCLTLKGGIPGKPRSTVYARDISHEDLKKFGELLRKLRLGRGFARIIRRVTWHGLNHLPSIIQTKSCALINITLCYNFNSFSAFFDAWQLPIFTQCTVFFLSIFVKRFV